MIHCLSNEGANIMSISQNKKKNAFHFTNEETETLRNTSPWSVGHLYHGLDTCSYNN